MRRSLRHETNAGIREKPARIRHRYIRQTTGPAERPLGIHIGTEISAQSREGFAVKTIKVQVAVLAADAESRLYPEWNAESIESLRDVETRTENIVGHDVVSAERADPRQVVHGIRGAVTPARLDEFGTSEVG